jgi:flagellar hook-associated protein FlgK
MSMSVTSSSSPGAIGLSGMRVAQLRLDTSAHNIANAQTPDFRRQTVSPAERPDRGGVEAQVGRDPVAASANGGALGHLAEDLVDQRVSLYSFAANLQTVQTEDRMLGALLDARA